MDTIMIPTVRAMEKEGRLFKGVLYAGLMIHEGEARVLEFNARFGDPETQPVMARLDTSDRHHRGDPRRFSRRST
jgi:phosphoribosylamine--glycine ligase